MIFSPPASQQMANSRYADGFIVSWDKTVHLFLTRTSGSLPRRSRSRRIPRRRRTDLHGCCRSHLRCLRGCARRNRRLLEGSGEQKMGKYWREGEMKEKCPTILCPTFLCSTQVGKVPNNTMPQRAPTGLSMRHVMWLLPT